MERKQSPKPRVADDVLARVRSGDPREALSAIRECREVLQVQEDRAVRLARQEGMSWDEIASLLGRVKSSVWERHHGVDEKHP